MSGITKSLGTIAAVVLGVAAVVFTAGAAIPAIGALVGAGGFSAAVGGVVSDLGLTGVLGDVVTGAVASAGTGAALGGAISGITGGNVLDGALSGAETGAVTGGITGGLGIGVGGATDPTASAAASAGAADPTAGGAVIGTTADTGVAADGIAGAADPTATAASAAAPVATASAAPVATTGAATGGGLLTPNPTGIDESNPNPSTGAASSGAAGTTTAAPAPVASTTGTVPNVKIPGATYVGADGVTYTSNGTSWSAPGGIMSSLTGSGGLLGNGGLGYAISGIGQGLLAGQTASDQAGYTATAAKTALQATQANYGQTTDPTTGAVTTTLPGGLLNQAQPISGLPKPAQAFNPTSKALVLVPATGTAITS